MSCSRSVAFFCCILLFVIASDDTTAPWNPFSRHLPDCRQPHRIITKKTTKKGIACPMIRDEQGFLAEWIAYHEMHGFNHIMIFDHGSSDNYTAEIEPWLTSGFVSVYTHDMWPSILPPADFAMAKRKGTFHQLMDIKAMLESFCKQQAIEWGYDYFVSLDLDEYVVPIVDNVTVMDALDNFFVRTRRNIYPIGKYNFQQAPHTVEPINLLTIEAYMNRMPTRGMMTYFKTVMPKIAIRLKNDGYNKNVTDYLAHCCQFHGCGGRPACNRLGNPLAALSKNYSKSDYIDALVIHHYSRSLEKFGLKAQTWQTAGNSDNTYHLEHFLDRNLGHHFDPRMLRYTCQLRHHLISKTGQDPYFRSGNMWYRNVEFGFPLLDGKKARRGDGPVTGYTYPGEIPDHYFGYYTSLSAYRRHNKENQLFGSRIVQHKKHHGQH